MALLIQEPLHVNLQEAPSQEMIPKIKLLTDWTEEEVVVAALYLGGLIYLHGFGWKRLRYVDTDDVTPLGMTRHVWQFLCEHFYFSGLPRDHLVAITENLADTYTEARGRVLIDGLIVHILPPFLGITPQDGGEGEPIVMNELLRKAS